MELTKKITFSLNLPIKVTHI